MSETKYTTFIDNAGRSIFGINSSETKTSITVENPVMIHVAQQENGQMAVQLFPLFFAEFVQPNEDESRKNFFVYNKSSVALGEGFDVDPRISEQYERIVNPTLVPAGSKEGEGEEAEVIKLFDE
jgi:hypothetical protein|tara:strand:+ start:996 stop:1370 length:375 start_codon:yes stop_codon:yes gene_type:complete